MVTIAAVNVGNYRGMGARYVNALFRGCSRHLSQPFVFACFTDDATGLASQIEPRAIPAGLDGYYNKLALFRSDAFKPGERVLYIDLDTVVLSNIDGLASYSGPFAALSHPAQPAMINSSIMAWEAGRYDHVWEWWTAKSCPTRSGGDQAWIYEAIPEAIKLQTLFPRQFRSFKIECASNRGPAKSRFDAKLLALRARYLPVPYPNGARIVYFHGQPKPHNCRSKWVREAWNGS